MAFDLPTLVRTLHVITAALWFGGGVLMAFVLGPSLRAAGPAAGPFMMTLMRRGGLSPYFMSVGGTAVLLGFYLYYAYDYHTGPFASGMAVLVTIGGLMAVIALGHGLLVLMPNERRIKALVRSIAPGSPPTPDQGAQMAKMGEAQGKHSALSALTIALTFILMTTSRLF